MPLSSHYVAALSSSGLDTNSVRRMSQLDDAAFLGMLMNDYATYGVVDLEDKQKLFRWVSWLIYCRLFRDLKEILFSGRIQRLLKGMNEEARGRPRAPAPPPPRGPQIAVREGDLLDLDAHDGDLLSHVGIAVRIIEVPIHLHATFHICCLVGMRPCHAVVTHGG